MNASSISRLLKREGFRPIPSGSDREGLKVRRGAGGTVFLRFDFDSDRKARTELEQALEVLTAAGYGATIVSDRILHVVRDIPS